MLETPSATPVADSPPVSSDPPAVSLRAKRRRLRLSRGTFLGVLFVAGVALGATYLSVSGAVLAIHTTNISSTSGCAWYTSTNTTDDWAGNPNHNELIDVLSGWGTSSVTIQFNLSAGSSYQDLVDEMVGVCALPAGSHAISVGVSSPVATSAGSFSWLLVTVNACSSNGCSGAISGGGAWTAAAGSANIPNNPSSNPTSKGSSGAVPLVCDYAGGGVYGPYGTAFGPSGSGNSAPLGPTYSYSLNATAPGWTQDACTTGKAAPPAISTTVASASTLAFYFVSIEATGISVSASGTPGLTLSIATT